MESSALLLAKIAFSLAGLCFLACFLFWISKKLWSGRDDWCATSSYPILTMGNDPQRAIVKDRRKQWHSPEPQKLGAWFEVDMAKPRYVAKISFETDDGFVEKPEEWQRRFYREGHNDIVGHKIGKGLIFVKGKIYLILFNALECGLTNQQRICQKVVIMPSNMAQGYFGQSRLLD